MTYYYDLPAKLTLPETDDFLKDKTEETKMMSGYY